MASRKVDVRHLGRALMPAVVRRVLSRGRRSVRPSSPGQRKLMMHWDGAVAVLDDGLRLVDASRPFEKIFGARPAALYGCDVASLLRVEQGGSFGALLTVLDSTMAAHAATALVGGETGQSLSIRAVKLGGRYKGWFIILTNHSQQTRFDRMKSDFVSTVSHELRTPLSSIAGALGLVAAGAAGEISSDASELVGIALNNTNRLIRLINDLLDVERIESGRLHFEIERRSLGSLIRTAMDEIKPFSDQHKVELRFDEECGADFVRVDGDRIVQVFTNLLSNAIKFSPTGGKVVVRMSLKPAFHRVEFIDNGSGIPEEFRKRIFTKFAQADGSGSRRVGGTGLGLAISRQIMERLDGKLWFDDNPEGGTIFYVDLPAAPPQH